MINLMSCRFHKCFGRFDMLTVEEYYEAELFKHFVSTCLWDSVVSEIYRPWELPFFSKCLKFNADFKNRERNLQNVFTSWDNCIWIRSWKFQILQREWLSPAVNVITKSRKSSNITNKRRFLSESPSEIQHNFMKVLSWRFYQIWDPLTCWLLNGAMKRSYLDICVTMPFTICNFKNTHSTKVNLVSKYLKFDVHSRNWIKY